MKVEIINNNVPFLGIKRGRSQTIHVSRGRATEMVNSRHELKTKEEKTVFS